MKKRLKREMEVSANRKATVVIIIISVAILRVMRKYGKEKKRLNVHSRG